MLEQTREVLAWLNANQETVWPILVGIIALIAVSAILWAWHESPKAKRLQAKSDEIKENSRRQFKRMQSHMKNAGRRIYNAIVEEFSPDSEPTMVPSFQKILKNNMVVSCNLNSNIGVVCVTTPDETKNQNPTVVYISIDIRGEAPMIHVLYGPNPKIDRSEYGKLDDQKLLELIFRIIDHIHAYQPPIA